MGGAVEDFASGFLFFGLGVGTYPDEQEEREIGRSPHFLYFCAFRKNIYRGYSNNLVRRRPALT